MTKQNAEKIYRMFLRFYPRSFRQSFEDDLILIFHDMYADNNKHSVNFWFSLLGDIIKTNASSISYFNPQQYMANISSGKIQISVYNMMGGIFLFPFLFALSVDFVSRLIQGNLSHPNNAALSTMNNTFLYNGTILRIWLLVLPALAIIVNVYPLIQRYIHKEKVISMKTIFSIIIIFLGLSFIAIVRLHDFAPCVMNGFFLHGNTNLSQLINNCQRA